MHRDSCGWMLASGAPWCPTTLGTGRCCKSFCRRGPWALKPSSPRQVGMTRCVVWNQLFMIEEEQETRNLPCMREHASSHTLLKQASSYMPLRRRSVASCPRLSLHQLLARLQHAATVVRETGAGTSGQRAEPPHGSKAGRWTAACLSRVIQHGPGHAPAKGD